MDDAVFVAGVGGCVPGDHGGLGKNAVATDETHGRLVLRRKWGSGTTEYTDDTEGMLFGAGGFREISGELNHERHETHERSQSSAGGGVG
jgi:hypothetical protein